MDSKITCKQVEGNLDAFHDRELPAEDHAVIKLHVDQCATCTAALADINRVVHALKSLPKAQLSAETSANIDKLLEQQGKVVRLQPRVWAPLAVAAAAAAIFIGVKFAMPDTSSGPVTANNNNKNNTNTTQQTLPVAVKPADNKVNNTTANPIATNPTEVNNPPAIASLSKQDTSSPSTNVGTSHSNEIAKTPTPAVSPKKSPAPKQAPMVAAKQDNEPARIASAQTPDCSVSVSAYDQGARDNVIAADVSSNGDNFNDAIGLSTDEDGLYDIKM